MEQTTSGGYRPLHVRVPDTVHGALAQFARDSHRSLNGAVNYLLARGLESELQPADAIDPIHTR